MSGRRIVVVSPHLDDAVLSLGATIRAAARAGDDVCVLTVFAGDPGSVESASEWDARAGFRTGGEAARVRRDEDTAACAVLGARTRWLEGTRRLVPDELRQRLADELGDADHVLIPGFPCTHGDHELVARLVLAAGVRGELALYVEQPYAMWRLLGSHHPRQRRMARMAGLAIRARGVRASQEPDAPAALRPEPSTSLSWRPARASTHDRIAKYRASLLYRSQIRLFGRELPVGIALYEWGWGGEGIARVPQALREGAGDAVQTAAHRRPKGRVRTP
jgi:LmbE family N-acetylglucosaminyl deacetylase